VHLHRWAGSPIAYHCDVLITRISRRYRLVRARGGVLSHIHRPDAVLQHNDVLPPHMSVSVPIEHVYVCSRYADLEGCL
jgi:hypothetical protein